MKAGSLQIGLEGRGGIEQLLEGGRGGGKAATEARDGMAESVMGRRKSLFHSFSR